MDTEYLISQALRDLASGRYSSLRATAAAYHLDHTLLSRRRRGQQNRVQAHEEQQRLSSTQEGMLVRWILDAEKAGHAFNHAQLRDMASIICRASGGDGKVGQGWVRRFLRRHPEVHSKKGVTIANQRVHDLYSSTISEWFSQLQVLIRSHNIADANIWNMDETGSALGICSNQTMIGTAATKRSYVSKPENREWVSIIECISAAGQALVPLVIFKGKRVQHQWFIPHKTPDWVYTSSEAAYTNNDIGLQWLREIFISQTSKDLPHGQYRLLLLDGHRSHTSLEFMWECHKNRIIPYYLVAHASHILQPLDLTIFSSLKRTYRAALTFHSDLDDTAPVKKQRFLEYYRDARISALSTTNILSGFLTAGIVPWCPRKALASPFIVHRDGDEEIPRPASPNQSIARPQVPSTPTNRRELYQAVGQLPESTSMNRDLRSLVTKTGRALDRLQFQLASTERQLATYKRQLENHTAKSKRKEPVDPNKVFVDIVDIKASHDRGMTQSTTTRSTATRSTAMIDLTEVAQVDINAFQRVTDQLRSIGSL